MPTGHPGTKAPHGTVSRYNNHGCRCDDCTNARRAYYGHRPREVWAAEIEPEHGTESRYTSPRFSCRCRLCTEAMADARRTRRQSPNPAQHGSVAYRNGCRCAECRAAWAVKNREYRRARRARKAAGG